LNRLSSIVLGTQYYRPPFPERGDWARDLRAMREAGLGAVQLWVVWGWCEPEPGRFDFSDYDELFDLAAQAGLSVALSVLPELNPFWLERVLPDGAMVDLEGRRLHSGPRGECLSGAVPGACWDHPEVHCLMTRFLDTAARHFAPRPNLCAWDVWNENRWRNQAPDVVCFCEHSLARFQNFLRQRHGSLEQLGRAWGRRVCDWSDAKVTRLSGHCYPQWLDFTHWQMARAAEMARWRVQTIRNADPVRPVGSHTGNPTVLGGRNLNENLFSRGNDWDIAAGDFYGFSSFPISGAAPGNMTGVDLAARMSLLSTTHAEVWLSELQGGPCCLAGEFAPPLSGAQQQSWIWTGLARGAKGVFFWCWRPEVFGAETAGFGFTAPDGCADDRAAAMRRTAAAVADLGPVLREYQPDRPRVAVVFARDSYFYNWMQSQFHAPTPYRAAQRWMAYLKALERLHVPYAIVDDRHLPATQAYASLILAPDACGLCDDAAAWLLRQAHGGATVMVEGGAAQRDRHSFYRELEHWPIESAAGLRPVMHRRATAARRRIPAGAWPLDAPVELVMDQAEIAYQPGPGAIAMEPDGLTMLADRPVGQGRVICLGAVVGDVTEQASPALMDGWVSALLRRAGVVEPLSVSRAPAHTAVRIGSGGGRRMLIATKLGDGPGGEVTLTLREPMPEPGALRSRLGHEPALRPVTGGWQLTTHLAEHDAAVWDWPAV
jgi:beta-galactosidase